jgi:hypothetical protein
MICSLCQKKLRHIPGYYLTVPIVEENVSHFRQIYVCESCEPELLDFMRSRREFGSLINQLEKVV